jgi:hypothetical protein
VVLVLLHAAITPQASTISAASQSSRILAFGIMPLHVYELG